MAYFQQYSSLLEIREGLTPNAGLRRGQVGALYALAAHFIERNEPAIVSLPTGYGKTAILTGICFLMQAKRVLVVTPTNALRTQITKAFQSLETLRRLNILPREDKLVGPKVIAIEHRINSVSGWKDLEEYDVVVCTPHSASPDSTNTSVIPETFFDLVLIDEGHHSPARTWSSFIHATPEACHALFSATPFRRDKRELPGRLIFYYSLRKAVEEKAFGKVTYCPVIVSEDASRDERDLALISKAVEIYERDTKAGLQHRLLARTEKVIDAQRLANLYVIAGLKVEAVSSKKSKQQIAMIEQKLNSGALDGVVCVDMFGEGYDFPKFKIAVLHNVHKSLVPTLQFIGRFARTNDEHTGTATFLAIPRDVNTESSGLYRDGVDWETLLADTVDAHQQLELHEREILKAFAPAGQPSANYELVNLSAFRLSQHIVVYKTIEKPNFSEVPEQLQSLQITNAWKSDDSNTMILLAKLVHSPAWYRDSHVIDAKHECFLIKYFPISNLIFITATQRSGNYYNELLKFFVNGNAASIAFEDARKVLNGMTDQEFFSVGIRSTSPVAIAESYRIVAGKNADRGIRDTDANNFSQGHFMGRGEVDGESEIIGVSARGRIWSNGKLSITDILNWMAELHERMTANQINIGRSGLDILSYGETLQQIPESTCMADWPKEAYQKAPAVFILSKVQRYKLCILDLEIRNFSVDADGLRMTFEIGDGNHYLPFCYRLNQVPHYVSLTQDIEIQMEVYDGREEPIQNWLETHNLVFFTKELASFSSNTIQKRRANIELRSNCLIPFDWSNCEIQIEFDINDPTKLTVQKTIQNYLMGISGLNFIIFDHRAGEAADFITIEEVNNRLHIKLYHCKGAGNSNPGARVEDVYELACQAVKSGRFQSKDYLVQHIERRTEIKSGKGWSPMLLGDRDNALALFKKYSPIDINLTIYAVQPGLSEGKLAENVTFVMAAANDSLTAQGINLQWIISP
ncbi:TPA: DEAD/DEAH box helicase [Legionella pneumophila]